jgi:hypothetical protein
MHDELAALTRADAEKGYMSPDTPASILSTCRCQYPYLKEDNSDCKNWAQSNTGRNRTGAPKP